MRVSDRLELLANGASIEEILSDYPALVRDDVLAAIAYAAVQTSHAFVRVTCGLSSNCPDRLRTPQSANARQPAFDAWMVPATLPP